MFRVLKFLLYLLVVAALGIVGYAYFGDLSPEVTPVSAPVTFDAR